MFSELERRARCHQRYVAPFGHRCPHASFADRRTEEFERGFRSWLETSEGRFAQYLAQRERAA
jgi:hypothetical protein